MYRTGHPLDEVIEATERRIKEIRQTLKKSEEDRIEREKYDKQLKWVLTAFAIIAMYLLVQFGLVINGL